MITPIEVAFVTASTALVSSFVSPLITLRMTRAQIRASVVSNNRQRWIETLRDLVAVFCAQAAVTAEVRTREASTPEPFHGTKSETLARIEQLARTFTTIRLMVNPNEVDHQALVALLTRIVANLRVETSAGSFSQAEIENLVEQVVLTSQTILKREWSRVKRGE